MENQSVEIGSSLPSIGNTTTGDSRSTRCKRKVVPLRADVWSHFDRFKDEDGVWRATCKYCKAILKADPSSNGTSMLRSHVKKSCKHKPADDQTQTLLTVVKGSENEGENKLTAVTVRYDPNAIRKAVTEMIIIDELPFKFVEGVGFLRMMALTCPKFHVPSRITIQRDCFEMFSDEKKKLKDYFKKSCQRLCLTTDTWTSMQRCNFMCLTARYIDDDWKLCKKLLNFCPISSHRGKDIGSVIEKCLHEWGIEKLFTITVDNAGSNDVALDYLRDNFSIKEGNVLNYKYLHMRCDAHILNLIVNDGLQFMSTSIKRIREAVKYIKQSPARLARFQECAAMEGIDCKASLQLDVCTRWNSTYTMLDSALKFEKVFKRYDDHDPLFRLDLEKEYGFLESCDWVAARKLCTFLKRFYDLTLKISGTKYVTSNLFYHEIVALDVTLKGWLDSDDNILTQMAEKMKEKFDKYWGNPDKMNMLIFFAVILDPRYKMGYLEFTMESLYGGGERMRQKMENAVYHLFNDYKAWLAPERGICRTMGTSSSDATSSGMVGDDDSTANITKLMMSQYKLIRRFTGGRDNKSELDKYLGEDLEDDDDKFDILLWWKFSSHRFPVLSQMARDIFSTPISTVASESVFSTGGRVLDAFRSSLSPTIAEALFCTQDWVRGSFLPIDMEESIEDQEKAENVIQNIGLDAQSKTTGNDDSAFCI